MQRAVSPPDQVIACLDQGLRLLFGPPPAPERPTPGGDRPDTPLERFAREAAGRLMRVNHAGEVCAQALYQGQALTARDVEMREQLERAAQEENDHLAWTAERIGELGSRSSYLNPLWYTGSFVMGAAAGIFGDRWSLGFLAETERQVVEHLHGHLARLPAEDAKSRAIVEQMALDESQHATVAIEAGAYDLPSPVQTLMRVAAKIMTSTAYWI